MSESSGIDLGRVISIIMENPRLIEEISTLVNTQEKSEPAVEETVAELKKEEVPTIAPISSAVSLGQSNRSQLLGALKPYVSKSRAEAIDSMLTIANILDMMKAR